MINVGVIGTGYIGPIHIETINRIGGVKVTAVADANRDLAEKTAGRFDIEKVYGNYREILQDPEIDVIHNCTPSKYHYEINSAAIKAGKHILAEKPLAINYKEAVDLTEQADKKGLITGVNFCYRYYPVVQEMARRIRNLEAGNIRMATGTWFQDWLFYSTDYSWRLEKSESGESNISADLGSHWLDLIQFVTGLKITKVFADFSTIIPIRQKPSSQILAFETSSTDNSVDVKIELEEYSSILFRLENNAPGSFTTCQACAGRKSDTEFQIYGDKCSFSWDHREATKLWIGHRDKANEILIESPSLLGSESAHYASVPGGHPLGYLDAEYNLFNDFYSVIKNGETHEERKWRPTFETGAEEMNILDSIVKSNKKKQWIDVK